MSDIKEKCTEASSIVIKDQHQLDESNLDFSTTSFSPTTSTKINMFSVPSVLSHTTSIISQDGHKDYIFTFMQEEKKQSAVLKPTFLTALQKDGLNISWEEAKLSLKTGCQVKIDVTQSKPAFFKRNWLVFGLYFGSVSDSGMRDTSSPGIGERRRLSKSFEWMKLVKSCKPSFSEIETQLADVEDSVFDFRIELDSATQALVKVREDLDDCMLEEDDDSSEVLSGKLNSTFTLPGHSCPHKNEVGVVVINVSDQSMCLVGPLNDTWVRMVVNPTVTPIFVRGEKIKNCKEVKVGEIGVLVSRKCVYCHVDDQGKGLETPLVVWFGEGNSPGLRKSPGNVVWVEVDKFLVLMDEGDLVMFTEKIDVSPVMGCNVHVWAWRRPGRCAVGGAWIYRDDFGGKQDSSWAYCKQFGTLDLSTSGIFSPIQVTDGQHENSQLNKTFSNKSSSDLSFGSISDCGELDLNKSFNTNLSIIIDHTSNSAKDVSSEDYQFQSLFSTHSSLCDDVDLDNQFEQVLVDNYTVDNYKNLARKYEKYFVERNLSRDVKKASAVSDNMEIIDMPSPGTCEETSSEVPQHYIPARKKSCPSLSPIPEENPDSCPDTSVFSTPAGKISDDSGYFDSSSAGSSFKPSKVLSYPPSAGGKSALVSDIPIKKPGCKAVLEDPAHSNEQLCVNKILLEQFLEFTQFPSSRRSEIIELFVAST